MHAQRHVERLALWAWFSPEVADVVEPILIAHPELRPFLAANSHLSERGWYALWPKRPRPSSEIAVSLANRELDKERRRHVLECDTRAKTLQALIEQNVLEPDEQKVLLASKGAAGKVAAELLQQPWVDPALAREAAERAGGWHYLIWLAGTDTTIVSDEEVSAFLAGYRSWEPKKIEYRTRSAALKKLLARRPAAIAAAVGPDQHEAVVTAAAGSRHLVEAAWQYRVAGITPGAAKAPFTSSELTQRKYALLALVNNPVCCQDVLDEITRQLELADLGYEAADILRSIKHRRGLDRPTVGTTYDKVEDPEVLDWLVRRSQVQLDPETDRQRPGQPHDLPLLAANPHLNQDQAEKVANALRQRPAHDALGDEGVRTALASLAERFEHVRLRGEQEPAEREPAEEAREAYLARERPYALRSAQSDCTLVRAQGNTSWMIYAEEALGTNAEAWEHFLGLVDTFEGTFAELTELAIALEAA